MAGGTLCRLNQITGFRLLFRSKNFEKGSDYANTWNKDDDGKVNVDGPRMVVGNDQMCPSGGFITKYVFCQLVGYSTFISHVGIDSSLPENPSDKHSIPCTAVLDTISVISCSASLVHWIPVLIPKFSWS